MRVWHNRFERAVHFVVTCERLKSFTEEDRIKLSLAIKDILRLKDDGVNWRVTYFDEEDENGKDD